METTPLGLQYPDETDTVTSYPAIAQQVAQWVDAHPGIARLTTAQRNALAAPDIWTGKAIYNTDTKTFQIYDPTNQNWSDLPSTNSAVITRSMLVSPTTGKLIGEMIVRPGGINSQEANYLVPADGSMLSSATWPLLDAHFQAVGYPYGRDAVNNLFGVPDCRDRVVIGSCSTAPGSGRSARGEGSTGGEETHANTLAEMPVHAHTNTDNGHGHGTTDNGHLHSINNPIGNGQLMEVADPTSTQGLVQSPNGVRCQGRAPVYSDNNTTGVSIHTGFAAIDVNSSGGNAPHNNMQPFIAMPCFIVAA